MRDSMIIYRSFYEAIKELPKEDQADIWSAVYEYGLNFQEIDLQGIAKTIFTLIKPQIEANIKRFKNGSKAKNKQKISKTEANSKQNGSKTEANNNNNVNNNVNKNVNKNENLNVNNNNNKKFADAKELINYMNDIGTCRYSFSNKNITSANARIKEHGLELMKKVLELKIWQTKQKRKDGNYIFDRKYFRPETIFNPNKAESYVNEVLSIQNGITDPNENKTPQSGFNDAANRLLEKYKKSIEEN